VVGGVVVVDVLDVVDACVVEVVVEAVQEATRITKPTTARLLIQLGEVACPLWRRARGGADDHPRPALQDVLAGRRIGF